MDTSDNIAAASEKKFQKWFFEKHLASVIKQQMFEHFEGFPGKIHRSVRVNVEQPFSLSSTNAPHREKNPEEETELVTKSRVREPGDEDTNKQILLSLENAVTKLFSDKNIFIDARSVHVFMDEEKNIPTIDISLEAGQRWLDKNTSDKFLAPFRRQYELTEAAAELKQKNPSYSLQSVSWQKLLTGDEKGQGQWFAVEQLATIRDKSDGFLSLLHDPHSKKIGDVNSVLKAFQNDEDRVLTEAIAKLKEMGFRRLALLSTGKNSLVFEGPPNFKGKKQIVMITDAKDKRIDCPIVLPSVMPPAKIGQGKFVVRLMPELLTGKDVEDVEVKAIRDIAESIGLCDTKETGVSTTEELVRKNIGILDYKGKRLPFVIDWGALGFACEKPYKNRRELTDEEAKLLEKGRKETADKWPTDNSLITWRHAIEDLKSQQVAPYNVTGTVREMRATLSRHDLNTNDPTRFHDIIGILDKYHLSIPELKQVVAWAGNEEKIEKAIGGKEGRHKLWALASAALDTVDLSLPLLKEESLPEVKELSSTAIGERLIEGPPYVPQNAVRRG